MAPIHLWLLLKLLILSNALSLAITYLEPDGAAGEDSASEWSSAVVTGARPDKDWPRCRASASGRGAWVG